MKIKRAGLEPSAKRPGDQGSAGYSDGAAPSKKSGRAMSSGSSPKRSIGTARVRQSP